MMLTLAFLAAMVGCLIGSLTIGSLLWWICMGIFQKLTAPNPKGALTK